MGDKYSPFLHDAVILYAIALSDTIAKGGDPRDGLTVAANMRGRSFYGELRLSCNGVVKYKMFKRSRLH